MGGREGGVSWGGGREGGTHIRELLGTLILPLVQIYLPHIPACVITSIPSPLIPTSPGLPVRGVLPRSELLVNVDVGGDGVHTDGV